MNLRDIDSIAYLIDKANKENKPRPIVFLGAGASITAGIPGADQIKNDILKEFEKKPEIKNLKEEDRNDYYKVMGCLNTTERIELLRSYITADEVRLNVAHIYLAQLLKEGFLDYVFTVNFDDLLLKASALFNFIPPTYDLSILKDFTTDTLLTQSVTYLHGQYNGFWLLNTKEEFSKVNDNGAIKRIFDSTSGKRTWIIVGYSGQDAIFDQIAKLGCFTNDLFWVTYNNIDPIENVQTQLLNKVNTNAYLVKGYDADSFFLKLHAEISKLDDSLETPEIFNTPFSFLKNLVENIKDIEEKENEHQELFNNVKERSEESKRWIEDAISKYEEGGVSDKPLSDDDIQIGLLKQEIIDAAVKGDFSKAREFLRKTSEINSTGLNEITATLFRKWGLHFLIEAEKSNKIELYKASVEKFETAATLDSKNYSTYNNWGIALVGLARLEVDKTLFLESIEKYKMATKLNPKDDTAFYNWGLALYYLGQLDNNKMLFQDSIEKYKVAATLNDRQATTFGNWGDALSVLGKLDNDKELYLESIEKYRIAADLDPNNSFVFFNWGIALSALAQLAQDKKLYLDSIEKYKIASKLNPKHADILYNWSNTLMQVSKLSGKDEKAVYLKQAEELLQQCMSLGGRVYNLACLYAITDRKNKAMETLKIALAKKEITTDFVKEDEDWKNYLNDEDLIKLLEEYK